jgi:hypothetical protein
LGIVAVLPIALSAIGFSGNSRRVTIDWGAAKAVLGTKWRAWGFTARDTCGGLTAIRLLS